MGYLLLQLLAIFISCVSKGDIEVKHSEDDTAKVSDGAAHY
jgi:hypothetical protein